MSIEVVGLDNLAALIRAAADNKKRGVAAEMGLVAEEMLSISKQMAPVDEYNLVDAIKLKTPTKGARDEKGRFAKLTWTLYVDTDVVAAIYKNGNIKTVGDYAYEIHEYMEPHGDKYHRGPKSQAKQDGGQYEVGGGFIDRAADIVEEVLEGRLKSAIDVQF